MLVPASILAANATLPHSFSAGTPIRAEEVNANFASLRDAVNTKADAASQAPVALTSGQRLKLMGFSSPDGLRVPMISNDGQLLVYDTNLAMYCEPGLVKTSPATQEYLCVPISYSTALLTPSGPVAHGPDSPPDYFFADASCTQPLYLYDTPPPAGMPASQKYVRTTDANGLFHLYQANTDGISRTAYRGNTDGSGCVPDTASYVFYTKGSEVPVSSLARMTAGAL
jgi:hypothetical protein